MDFFTVPTLMFGVLFCFFVIGHDRRKILHFNDEKSSCAWVVQQLREAWAYLASYVSHGRNYIGPVSGMSNRLLSSYLLYYHEDLGLAKDTPAGRATEIRCAGESKIQSFPTRLGGLHHRYAVAA